MNYETHGKPTHTAVVESNPARPPARPLQASHFAPQSNYPNRFTHFPHAPNKAKQTPYATLQQTSAFPIKPQHQPQPPSSMIYGD